MQALDEAALSTAAGADVWAACSLVDSDTSSAALCDATGTLVGAIVSVATTDPGTVAVAEIGIVMLAVSVSGVLAVAL